MGVIFESGVQKGSILCPARGNAMADNQQIHKLNEKINFQYHFDRNLYGKYPTNFKVFQST